jgi:hypothetical protein
MAASFQTFAYLLLKIPLISYATLISVILTSHVAAYNIHLEGLKKLSEISIWIAGLQVIFGPRTSAIRTLHESQPLHCDFW